MPLPSPKHIFGLFVFLLPSEPTDQRNVSTQVLPSLTGQLQYRMSLLPQQLLTAYIFSEWGGTQVPHAASTADVKGSGIVRVYCR